MRTRPRPDPFASETYGRLAVDRSYEVTSFDGATLVVDEVGPQDAGTGAVFLHGLGNDTSVWHHQVPALPAGGRYLFYDARGHGRSVRSGTASLALPTLAQDLHRVIGASGLHSLALIGHSMGGMTILQYCRDHPEATGAAGRVRGIVLANTTYAEPIRSLLIRGIPPPVQPWVRKLADWLLADPARWERLHSAPPVLLEPMVRWVGFARGASPTQVRYLSRFERAWSSPGLSRLLAAILAFDLEDVLAAIDVPALVVAGAQDRLTAQRASEFMAGRIPHSSLLVVEGAGHMAIMERPGAFNAALVDFLAPHLPLLPASAADTRSAVPQPQSSRAQPG